MNWLRREEMFMYFDFLVRVCGVGRREGCKRVERRQVVCSKTEASWLFSRAQVLRVLSRRWFETLSRSDTTSSQPRKREKNSGGDEVQARSRDLAKSRLGRLFVLVSALSLPRPRLSPRHSSRPPPPPPPTTPGHLIPSPSPREPFPSITQQPSPQSASPLPGGHVARKRSRPGARNPQATEAEPRFPPRQ